MKLSKIITHLVSLLLFVSMIVSSAYAANKMVTEAKSVIDGIQNRGESLSTVLEKFNQEFSVPANNLVQLEADIEELESKGYLGDYNTDPEKRDRLNAESAKYVSQIKDVFIKHYSEIQNMVGSFHQAVYKGKDRIADLRSDDLAVVKTELGMIKQEFANAKTNGEQLESRCPKGSKMARECQKEWRNYYRQMQQLEKRLSRLAYIKQIAGIKQSIIGKLEQILDKYMYRQSDIVTTLSDYAFKFEQYGSFIGTNDLGGMLQIVRELKQLDEKLRDFEQFQKGLGVLVADTGKAIDAKITKEVQDIQIDVESRGDALKQYQGKENNIERMIRQLEKEI